MPNLSRSNPRRVGTLFLPEIPLRGLTRWIHVEPLLAVVLWGSNYPVVRLALGEIPVLSFAFLRFILGACMLCPLWLPQRRPVPGPLWAPLAIAGIAMFVCQIQVIASLHWTTAGQSAILLAVSPIFTAVWLALRRRDHLNGRQWGGLLAGLIGVGLVVGGSPGRFEWSYAVGDLLALGSAAAFVWYSLAVSPIVGSIGAWQATCWALAIAALALVPLTLFEVPHYAWWRSVSWEAWGGLIYSAAAGFVVAMALWGRSMYRLGARQTMPYSYLEPVSAVVIAAVILGESLSAFQAVGAVLTLIGVWLASDSGSD
jgi:drug/metabolite transporter (DMT)-like permease